MVERVNRFLKFILKKVIEDTANWGAFLSKAQYVINNTYLAAIRNTPAKLLLGYDCRNHEDKALTDFVNSLAQVDTNFDTDRNSNRDITIEATEKLRKYNKQYYDIKHAKPTKYKTGEYVMIRDLQNKSGQNSKFKSNYKGPYLVSKILNNNRYVITDISGFNVSTRLYNAILSSDKIKPWVKPLNA